MGLLDAIKDQGVQVALNHLLGSIGTVSGLSIDRQQQRLVGTVTLDGDVRTVRVEVLGWTLSDATHPNAIRITQAVTDRAWITAVLQRLVVGRWLPVAPDMMKKITFAVG